MASEERLQQLLGEGVEGVPSTAPARRTKPHAIRLPTAAPTGPTEGEETTKVRLGQRFFRQSVLASYSSRCCITGNPVPELASGSHILPWSEFPEQRLNPRNGLCLAKAQDAAFDRKLITFDEKFRLMIGPRLKEYLPNTALEREFLVYEGKPLQMPDKFLPNVGFMRRHREEVMGSI